ncbi:hypothetical protein JL722_3994 [Aureococcus anophagefferens]|nr:hypothetical protein JL722_3994 [Aureococcus anophagefferens]
MNTPSADATAPPTRRRAAKAVNYAEPKLNTKLRQAETSAKAPKAPKEAPKEAKAPKAAPVKKSINAAKKRAKAEAADDTEAAAAKPEAAVAESAAAVPMAAITPIANPEGLSEYELERKARIERNEAFMASLGLGGGLAAVDEGKRKAASQRGVSRKRAKKAPSEPPRRSQRDVPLLADDEDDDAAAAETAAKRGAIVAALAAKEAKKPSARTPMDARAYRASLQSFALKEADVAKVTKDRTYSLAWLPSTDKLLIAAGDKSGRVGLWDVDDADGETCCAQFSDLHARPLTALAWRGAQLYSGGYDSFVRRTDFSEGSLRSTVVADYENDDCDDLTHWCLRDDVLWGAHKCGGLSRHDVREPAGSKKFVADAHGKKVAHVACRPGRAEVATSSNDGELKLWDVRKLGKKPTPLAVMGHDKSIHGFDFAPDGLTACSVSYDNTVAFWDLCKKVPTAVKVRHDNHTGRYLTPFKPVFDVHAPSPVLVVGSMAKPRAIDVVQAAAPHYLIKLNDGMGVFHAVTSIHAVHPFVHAIAGANNSGRVSLWRK